jgi:hypothetical protein
MLIFKRIKQLMKYLVVIILLAITQISYSQTFINRAGAANTVIDQRLGAAQNFFLPRLTDTTLSGGLDSIGNLIYDRLRAKIAVRDTVLTGGHKFTFLFKQDDTISTLATQYDLTQISTENISNAALTADGNYAQNWSENQWYVDSIGSSFLFRMGGIGNTGTRRKEFRINWGGSSFGDNLDEFNMLASIKKADLSADSLTMGLQSSGTGVLSAGTYDIANSGNNNFISYSATSGLININAKDSIWMKGAVSAATADTILGLVQRGALGTSKVVKIPLPASGISQLTGDVTAGPGSGSQAATITTNAVANSKFRQSVGTSVVGRSANSTGNVADIAATVANTYLRNSGTALGWDSVDYADLKNRPDLENPGVYFSPAQAFDPSFVVFSSGIAKTANAYSQGNPILWDFLDHTTSHNSSFYDSVYGSGSGITVRFPTVKNVLNTTITPDETFVAHMVSLGSSTAVNNFSSPVIQPAVLNIKLRGNGTTSWTTDNGLGLASHWSFSSFSSGVTLFNIVGGETTIDYPGLNIQYIGPNNWHIKRIYSGLGSFNAAFYILDEFGNAVTDNPTSNDEIVISAAATAPYITNMVTWQPTTQFMDGFANFWIFGAFECWLVASPTTSTSINVRWQPYPSATNYKIYRATSLYGSRTLVHTGTDNSYVDSGLSSGTLYWYFMIAVIGGVDTQITYFRTSTKAF